jgi:hypothetical protein
MRLVTKHRLIRHLPVFLFLILLYYVHLFYILSWERFFKCLQDLVVLYMLGVFYTLGPLLLATVIIYYFNLKIIHLLISKIKNKWLSFSLYFLYLAILYAVYKFMYFGSWDLAFSNFYNHRGFVLVGYIDFRFVLLILFLWQYAVDIYLKRKKTN